MAACLQVAADLTLNRRRGCLRIDEHHRGKPLVAVWGVGFSDDRDYGVAECETIVGFLKERGCAVMLGVLIYGRLVSGQVCGDARRSPVERAANLLQRAGVLEMAYGRPVSEDDEQEASMWLG